MGKRGERKADLLVAARRAMVVHGSAVRLTHIAQEAGVTSGAVLYHYPDTQALLIEANRAGMARFYDQRVAAIAGVDDPALRLVITIRSGLPRDSRDADVRLLCSLGGEASRNPTYAALLTALFDQQAELYRSILQDGERSGVFVLAGEALAIARNLVALEDAYGYRIMARHPAIDTESAIELILEYARQATTHPLKQELQ